jgi:hypothetical protein
VCRDKLEYKSRSRRCACVSDSVHAAAIFVGLYVPARDAAGQRDTFRALDAFELPACSSCKSTTLPQTSHHAHCGFTIAKNRGVSQIGQTKKLHIQKLLVYIVVQIIFYEVSGWCI